MTEASHHADLVVVEGNPAPPGIVVSSFRTPDGVRLRTAITPSASGSARGTVILLQGRNEAIEKYFETIADLTARGYAVATFDWRGQGGSQRLLRNPHRGHVRAFSNYLNDLESFVHDIVLPDCRGPFALLAHSMGALVALHASPRLVNVVERMVLSAPLIDFPPRPPRLRTLRVASSLLRYGGLGRLPVRPSLIPGRMPRRPTVTLTNDPRRSERNGLLAQTAPELFLGSPSVAWLAAMTKAMRRLERSDVVARLGVPTLIVAAGNDQVVSSAAAERLAWRMRSGSSLVIPQARHEILQETDRCRALFLAAFESFTETALPRERA